MSPYRTLPRVIYVSPYTVRVKVKNIPKERDKDGSLRQVWGWWRFDSQIIEIHNKCPSKIFLLDTVMHEINHAIYSIYYIHKERDEERYVSLLSTAWTQIYLENPKLIMWMCRMCVPEKKKNA